MKIEPPFFLPSAAVLQQPLRRGNHSIIIGFFGDFFDMLNVLNDAAAVNNENRPGQQTKFFDQQAVGLAK